MTRIATLLVLVASGWGTSASALAIVQVRPELPLVALGERLRVDLVADLDLPILGWGLDLGLEPSVFEVVGVSIGASWLAVPSADGDGLAGLASPVGVTGSDLLLASVTLQALAPGDTLLFADLTPGDLSEGFALDPSGFDSVTLGSAAVRVVPEPASGSLLAVALCTLLASARRSRC
jgi:hypothetical protein